MQYLAFVLSVIFGTVTAWAQQPSKTQSGDQSVDELPAIIVSATRLPNTPSGLAQSLTIISGDELRAQNFSDAKSAINTAVGIYVDQVGKAGGFSSVYVRGAEQSHLLVLIDGIRVNDATTTRGSAFDLSEIELASIERIEVLRGPGSAVHGGEALAGVINIVTKKGSVGKPQGSVHAGVGQFGYGKLGAQLGGGSEEIRYSISAGHEASGKHGDEEAFQRLNSVAASIKFTPSETSAIDVTLRHARRKSEEFPDGSGGERFALNRELENKESHDTIAGLGFSLGDFRTLRFEARASLFDRKEKSATPSIVPFDPAGFPVPGRTDDTAFKRKSLQLIFSREFSEKFELLAGAELQKEDGVLDENATALGAGRTTLDRETRSVFAEASFSPLPQFTIQAGLRRDSFDGDGLIVGQVFNFGTFAFDPINRRFNLKKTTQTTPHLGIVWKLPNESTILKASYSEGFKAPSFFALGNFLVGREDLKPERSRNIEAALQQKLPNELGSLDVSIFRVNYKDLVDLVEDFTAPIGQRLTNRGTIISTGIEPSITLRLMERLRIRGGFTLMNLDVRDGKEALPNRPEKKAFLTGTFDLNERHTISATANYVGPSIDQPIARSTEAKLGGYTTLDAAWSMKLGPTRLTLSVDNIFDKDYEQFFGFENFGRRFRFDVRAQF